MANGLLALFNLGGAEMILILAILATIALLSMVAVATAFLVIWLSRKNRAAQSPHTPPLISSDRQ